MTRRTGETEMDKILHAEASREIPPTQKHQAWFSVSLLKKAIIFKNPFHDRDYQFVHAKFLVEQSSLLFCIGIIIFKNNTLVKEIGMLRCPCFIDSSSATILLTIKSLALDILCELRDKNHASACWLRVKATAAHSIGSPGGLRSRGNHVSCWRGYDLLIKL